MPAVNTKSPDEKLRFAVYLRISRDPDGTSTATERQLEDCRRFAELRGWEIVAIYEDADVSAWRLHVERPEYDKMMAAMARGELDGVLVWRLDRLVRRTVEFSRFWEIAEANGVRLASATQPIDTSDPVGMLVVTILVAFAQMESETQSVRIRSMQAHLAEQGKASRGGARPYGLTDDWSEVVEPEAEVIRWAAEQALGGVALSALATELNKEEVPTVKGGPWMRSVLQGILTSGRTCGWREHHGELVAKGNWPAILDEADVRALRRKLGPRTRRPETGRGQQVANLLSGILRCGLCGKKMQMHSTKNEVGNGRHRRYICPAIAVGGCSGKVAVNAQHADEHIEAQVLALLASPSMAAAAQARRQRKATSTEADLLAELGDLDAQTNQLAAEQVNPATRLPRAAYLAEQRAIEARREQIADELAEARDDEANALELVKPGAGVEARYRALSLGQRRAVIMSLIEKVVVLRTDDPVYLERVRKSFLAEADEFARKADDARIKRQRTTDREHRKALTKQVWHWEGYARRRRQHAETGTGGGRWRPERLDVVWRT